MEKLIVDPMVCVNHSGDDLAIDIYLTGASKDSIKLDMNKQSFCVKAEGDNSIYNSCYSLAHDINPVKSKASYKEGLLSIKAPLVRRKDYVNVRIN